MTYLLTIDRNYMPNTVTAKALLVKYYKAQHLGVFPKGKGRIQGVILQTEKEVPENLHECLSIQVAPEEGEEDLTLHFTEDLCLVEVPFVELRLAA
ncbi:MAG: hypothetical protein CMG78_12190 [Marinobacter sp.]|nr:hypothetical protein [Marinobacter sp.]|tara:strand:- start:1342 stop:1629 length:288 start_codon:yes stop_codon:yes gene_type:complete